MPVSSVQYPSISEEATRSTKRSTVSASSGPVTGYLPMPLASESLTRCVVWGGHNVLSWSLNYSITDPAKTSLTNRESYLFFPLAIQDYPFICLTSFSPIQPITRAITTTSSLSPQLGTIQHPSLTAQHQISRGYHPSIGSMSHRPSHSSHSALLSQKPESAPHPRHQIYQRHPPNKSMIPSRSEVSDPVARELKSVSFPHDCMDRFTSIASINTAENIETCGLLLGKNMGGRYVVTTLLIPKQHATSDTCAIDEEELVMQFTEGRSLIILGWVYCHLCWWIGALC